jgi:catechol 2,3-dioxygenase-like lactoylglutathione lyase family enzyme
MTRILQSATYFPVADVAEATAAYEQTFGFTTDYIAGSPAEFAISSRDGQSVMFRRVPDPSLIRPNEAQGGTWDVFFWVDDADALCAELAGRGAQVAYGPLNQEAYHMREFAVRDLNGYVLGFGQALPG